MDNLSFDQVAVPEPTGAALGVLALGAMAMRRRRA
jgi:MYXO-CTERM domain-containing protein